jgi:hypothetical protein
VGVRARMHACMCAFMHGLVGVFSCISVCELKCDKYVTVFLFL